MALFFKKGDSAKPRQAERILPRHLGIIMDGNGRWAKKRGMPRSAGHTVGAANFKTITRYCAKIGIEYLTVYAFSTENWKRPSAEINGLMKLFKQYLEESLRDFRDDDIKVRFIGDTEAFSSDLRQLIEETREVCKDRTGMVLNIAMNYGGRDEIRRAVTNLAEQVQAGTLQPEEITEEKISAALDTAGIPEPDLLIRTCNELRISNFLLWQLAYTEFYFTPVAWPDFSKAELEKAIEAYNHRDRRYGLVKEE